MRNRDVLIALAVCAGLAAPASRGIFQAARESQTVVVQQPVLPDQPKLTPAGLGLPATATPAPRSCDPEPEGDGCPSCGMARVEPRGKKFLRTYVSP